MSLDQNRQLHQWLDAVHLGQLFGGPQLPSDAVAPTEVELEQVRAWHAQLTGEDLERNWLAVVLQPQPESVDLETTKEAADVSKVNRARHWWLNRKYRLRHGFLTEAAWQQTMNRAKRGQRILGWVSLALAVGGGSWVFGRIAPALETWGRVAQEGIRKAGSESAFWATSQDPASVAHAVALHYRDIAHNLGQAALVLGVGMAGLMLWMAIDGWIVHRKRRRISAEERTIWAHSPRAQVYLARRPAGMPFLEMEAIHLHQLARRDGALRYMKAPAGTWPDAGEYSGFTGGTRTPEPT